MTDYMKEFIEDNIELIEAGKLERLLNKCNIGYRAELKNILEQIQAEKADESKYFEISLPKVFSETLAKILHKLGLYWSENFINNSKDTVTYKYIGVYGPINREYQIERDIGNELDKLDVKYNAITYNPYELISTGNNSFHTATLRIRIVK